MKLLIAFLAAAALPAQVRIEKTTWHGWSDALVMKNAAVAVVIVPSIGRVMQFSLLDKTGQATEGPLWNNRAMDGKAVEPASPQWGNFGGDKSWPELQADWPTIQKRGWPPPVGFDASTNTVAIKGTTVMLTTPVDASYGIQELRTIDLDPNAAVMTISTSYEKVAGEPVKTGIWTITQLTSPENIYIDAPKASVFENGYANLSPNALFEVAKEGERVRVRRDPAKTTKMGTDGNWLLWTGADADGNKLSLKIERTSVPAAGQEWPDNGARLEVYTNPDRGGQPYVEMEVMGPMRTMKIGDKATAINRYTLTRDRAK